MMRDARERLVTARAAESDEPGDNTRRLE